MKVLLISTSVVPLGGKKYGGIEGLVSTFARGLKAAGQDVTVAAPVGSVVPDGVKLIETVKLPEEQDNDRLALIRMDENSQHEWIQYDVVHDFSHGHILARAEENIPVISMLWDNITIKYNKAPYNIICLSNWQKERFEKMYNQKAVIMPMCVDTDIYHPISNPARERFLFLGKISADKGVHLAIKYAKDLGVPLSVVGGLIDSELNSPYLKEIEKLCDGERIRLHFNVDEATKVNFLQNAKALIYPVQMVEAHWLTGIEAWCCGLPTITYSTGSKVEILPDPFLAVEHENQFKKRMYDIDIYNAKWVKKIAVDRYAMKNVIPLYLDLYQRVSSGERW